MNKFINDYKLLNAKEADINAENAPLWSIEYTLLTSEDTFQSPLIEYIEKCKTNIPGLYNQFPFIANGRDNYMSPDQLIAFTASLAVANRTVAIKSIWSYLVKHLFTYDNISGRINFRRTMQLGALLFVASHSKVRFALPALSIVLIYSCLTKRKETSGKLKAWVMFKSLNMKKTESICNLIIKNNSYLKSWYGVFKEYFKEEGHPLPIEAKKYYA